MRRAHRLHSALAAALCAHAAAAWALLLLPKGGIELHALPLPDQVFFVSEEPPSDSSLLPSKDVAPRALVRPSAAASPGSAAPGSTPELTKSAIVAVKEEPMARLPADSAGRVSNPSAPIDLGIASLWKSVALADAPPSRINSSPEPSARPFGDRIFRDVLDAHDQEAGLGPGGPLLTAAHEAGSMVIAPDTGTATFDVESDATGKVTTANVVSVSADVAGWAAVANELVTRMTSKRLRVPRGARGLRTRLRITLERVLPSGKKVTTHLGAVPDDVAGGGSGCTGVGWSRKCEKGMPVGVTLNPTDVANFGASASRIVRAEILGERTL